MSRKIVPWCGKTDDAMPPRSVFDRLWERQGGRDAITGVPFTSKDRIVRDHIVPLADGGKNEEENLQLITAESHKPKTAAEATARAKTRRIHERDRGYQRKPWATQRLGNGNQQHTATRPLKKRVGHFEEAT
jgi:5-methylcytosine-specific restriction endonuclease McrA